MIYEEDILMHHGIKGQKWGVRRYQNPDGSLTEEGRRRLFTEKNLYRKNGETYLREGSIVKRVSVNRPDTTYDNKKYVSISQKDHDKWEKYFGASYLKAGMATFNQEYKTNKELKVLPSFTQGKLFTHMMINDPIFSQFAIVDIENANKFLHLKPSNDPAENISRNIAAQTKTGKDFVDTIRSLGYDAVIDTHGRNVSKNPLIVFDPDVNLTKTGKETYTKPVQEYLDRINKKEGK